MGETHLESYLSSLPAGAESHPHCQTKAALAHSALEGQDRGAIAARLPDPIAAMVRAMPAPGLWIPAVWSDAVFHAVCDHAYPDIESMDAWCYERTRRMARNPIYRGLLKAAGPGRFFRMGARANRLFQRGTTLRNDVEPGHLVARMGFPSHLHDEFNLRSNVPALRAMAEITGGKDVEVSLREHSPLHATYDCRWAT